VFVLKEDLVLLLVLSLIWILESHLLWSSVKSFSQAQKPWPREAGCGRSLGPLQDAVAPLDGVIQLAQWLRGRITIASTHWET